MNSPVFLLMYCRFSLQKVNKTLDFQRFSDRLWRRERDSKPGGRQPFLISELLFFTGLQNSRFIHINRPFFEGSHPLSIKNKKPQCPVSLDFVVKLACMAEREGFEPSDRVNSHTISSRAPSTNSAISPFIELLLVL